MTENEKKLAAELQLTRDALIHSEAASLASQEVLLSIVARLIESNQVFTRAEALKLQKDLQKSSAHHKSAHEILRGLVREGVNG